MDRFISIHISLIVLFLYICGRCIKEYQAIHLIYCSMQNIKTSSHATFSPALFQVVSGCIISLYLFLSK